MFPVMNVFFWDMTPYISEKHGAFISRVEVGGNSFL
jgi:hypothetical protein